MAKTAILERAQSLEQMVMGTSHVERNGALAGLGARIQPILQPRTTTTFGGSPHFLPNIPSPPLTRVTRGGLPMPASEKEQQRFQQELQVITAREQELVRAAQAAKSKLTALEKWAEELGETEDRLLISVLDEADRPDVEQYLRQHARFVRTCTALADSLKF